MQHKLINNDGFFVSEHFVPWARPRGDRGRLRNARGTSGARAGARAGARVSVAMGAVGGATP